MKSFQIFETFQNNPIRIRTILNSSHSSTCKIEINSCENTSCCTCLMAEPPSSISDSEPNGISEDFHDCLSAFPVDNKLTKNNTQLIKYTPEMRPENKNYSELVELYESNLVSSSVVFQCPSCLLNITPQFGVVLQDCLHSFCKNCLAKAIEISETGVVKCPYHDSNYACESHLRTNEIKSLVPPHIYDRLVHQSIRKAESDAQNSFHCKTPQCPGWCFVEQRAMIFNCPVCHHANCINCAAIHEFQSCDIYQSEIGKASGDSNKVKNVSAQQDSLKRKHDKDHYTVVLDLSNEDNYSEDIQIMCEMEKRAKSASIPNTSSDLDDLEIVFCDVQAGKAAAAGKPEIEIIGEVMPKDYNTLLKLYDFGLVSNAATFECPICFVEIPPKQGVTLQDCLHSFCKECLENAVKFSEDVLVKCPFLNEEYSCTSHLKEREIKCLVSKEAFERYLQRSIRFAESSSENSFHCKTPDCQGWCEFEYNVNTFLCPVCHRSNCITCAAIHEGKNCRQYQAELADLSNTSEEMLKTRAYFKKMLDQKKAMKCTCGIVVFKNTGCDAMICAICKTELCWATKGPRWGPKGRGDNSGGCQCNVWGKKCHPSCHNCH